MDALSHHSDGHVLSAIHNGTMTAVQSAKDDSFHLYNGTVGLNVLKGLCDNLNAIGSAESRLAKDVCDVSRDVLEATHKLSSEHCDIRSDIAKEGRLNEQGFGRTNENILREARALETSLCEKFSRTGDQIHAVEKTVYQEAQELKLGQCRIERQIADGLAQVKLDALQNKFELSQQLAECCCKGEKERAEILKQIEVQACFNREESLKQRIAELQGATSNAALLDAIRQMSNGPGNSGN